MRFVKKFNNYVEYVDLWQVIQDGTSKEKDIAVKILRKAYDEIYIKTFPIPSEQESFVAWEKFGSGKYSSKEQAIQTFTIFGFDLATKPVIIAFIATSFYKTTATGLIDYVVRLKNFRHLLSAAEICAYQEKVLEKICAKYDACPLKMILWEANDPSKISWDSSNPDYSQDCMDPEKRIQAIEQHMRCARIGCSYVQVPIHFVKTFKEIDEGICDNLLLYMYNAPQYQNAKPEDLEKYISVFSKSLNGHLPYQLKHPLVDKMMSEIVYMKKKNIPLLYDKQTPSQREGIQKQK